MQKQSNTKFTAATTTTTVTFNLLSVQMQACLIKLLLREMLMQQAAPPKLPNNQEPWLTRWLAAASQDGGEFTLQGFLLEGGHGLASVLGHIDLDTKHEKSDDPSEKCDIYEFPSGNTIRIPWTYLYGE